MNPAQAVYFVNKVKQFPWQVCIGTQINEGQHTQFAWMNEDGVFRNEPGLCDKNKCDIVIKIIVKYKIYLL